MEKKQKKKSSSAKSKIDEAEKLRRRLQSLVDKKQSNSKSNGPTFKSAPKNDTEPFAGSKSKVNASPEKPFDNKGQDNSHSLKKKISAKIKNLKAPLKQQTRSTGKTHLKPKVEPVYYNGLGEKHFPTSEKHKSSDSNGRIKISTKKNKGKGSPISAKKKLPHQKSSAKQVNPIKRKAPLAEAKKEVKKKYKLTPFQDVCVSEASEADALSLNSEKSAASSNSADSYSAGMLDISHLPGFVGYSSPDGSDNDLTDDDRYFYAEDPFAYDESYSEDDNSFDDSDEEEEEEEEEENYSDYDEHDYEEEEDSHDYFSDDMDFYSTESDDTDYRLPEDVPEDLIIHQGTAVKRSLELTDNIVFDSDNEEAQLIELEEQMTVKIIEQPKLYAKTELLKLSETILGNKEKDTKIPEGMKPCLENYEITSNETDCPKLVPVADKDGFQLYSDKFEADSTVSIGSEYQEVTDSDDLSFNDEDVNIKYLPGKVWNDFENNQEYTDDNGQIHMQADVIFAENTNQAIESTDNIQSYENSNGDDVLLSEKLYMDLNMPFKGDVITVNVSNKSKGTKNDVVQNFIDKIHEANLNEKSPLLTPEDHVKSKPAGQLKSESSSCTLSHMISSRSVFCNAIDSNHVLVQLRDPLYIYGTVKLILIAGSVEIFGYKPRLGEELEIFSPRGLSTVEITPLLQTQTPRAHIEKEIKRLKSYFAKSDIDKVAETYVLHQDSLIILQRNEKRKQLTDNFKKYMSENIFPNMNSIQTERPHYASEYLLRCIINTQSDKALRIPKEWSDLKLETRSRLMLIGGKAVGKSTMLRYLVNKHLNQYPGMLLIDLDIGQPEVFVPQTISATFLKQPLVGAGFMLNLQPDLAFAIGHSNIVLCPHLYMRAVQRLLDWCNNQAQYANVPWLINTMGYNKGFGAELVAVVCELQPLTDVVQLQSNKEINNYDFLMEPHVVAALPRNIYSDVEFQVSAEKRCTSYSYRLHIINSAILQEGRYQREWDMSAKDMRYAIMLARLSEILVGSGSVECQWLTDCRPLCTSLDSIKIVNLLPGEYTREQLLKAVEANIVYLCQKNENTDLLQCFGIGIVRAIDYHVNQIYLLPAVPNAVMNTVNCLAIGEMPLPTSMFTNQGPKVKNIAPFVYNTDAANASKSIKQIYHRPKASLGGKHET